jgi:ATP-dependent Clp protease ATP-binding subunit ClpB
VDFRNTVIIMTSNLGSQWILEMGTSDWPAVERRVQAALRQQFRPEFLNRVDDVVVFRPLGEAELERIVELQLARVERLVADKKLTLEVTPAARKLLASDGYDPVYGARPLKRAIQRLLQNPLALAVLEGAYDEGDAIRADVAPGGGGLVFGRVGGDSAAGGGAAGAVRGRSGG